MLAKKPEDRWQTPREVAAALAPYAEDSLSTAPTRDYREEPIPAAGKSAAPTLAPRGEETPIATSVSSTTVPRRRSRWLIAAALCLIALVGGGGVYFMDLRNDPPPPPPTEPPNLDLLRPLQTHLLLERRPVPALWPKQNPHANLTFDAAQRQLTVTSPFGEDSLFHLGTVTTGNFQLQVRIYQVNWNTGVGVYFGYHKVNRPAPKGKDRVIADMQMIFLGRESRHPKDIVQDLSIIRGPAELIQRPDSSQYVSQVGKASDWLSEINDQRTLTIAVLRCVICSR